MSKVTIGCRLPTGLILDLSDPTIPVVELAGQRQAQERSKIVLLGEEDYGTTEVDKSFWEAFKARVGPEYAPIKSGAIFEAKSEKESVAVAKDLKGKKTGHEPLPQEVGDIKKA
jgi:hypothetical protein